MKFDKLVQNPCFSVCLLKLLFKPLNTSLNSNKFEIYSYFKGKYCFRDERWNISNSKNDQNKTSDYMVKNPMGNIPGV